MVGEGTNMILAASRDTIAAVLGVVVAIAALGVSIGVGGRQTRVSERVAAIEEACRADELRRSAEIDSALKVADICVREVRLIELGERTNRTDSA